MISKGKRETGERRQGKPVLFKLHTNIFLKLKSTFLYS